MGQILDGIRKGKCCDLCGSYFLKNSKPFTHGYPATCMNCWQALPIDERTYHRKAEVFQTLTKSVFKVV